MILVGGSFRPAGMQPDWFKKEHELAASRSDTALKQFFSQIMLHCFHCNAENNPKEKLYFSDFLIFFFMLCEL